MTFFMIESSHQARDCLPDAISSTCVSGEVVGDDCFRVVCGVVVGERKVLRTGALRPSSASRNGGWDP